MVGPPRGANCQQLDNGLKSVSSNEQLEHAIDEVAWVWVLDVQSNDTTRPKRTTRRAAERSANGVQKAETTPSCGDRGDARREKKNTVVMKRVGTYRGRSPFHPSAVLSPPA
jgi:hypothetical protein